MSNRPMTNSSRVGQGLGQSELAPV